MLFRSPGTHSILERSTAARRECENRQRNVTSYIPAAHRLNNSSTFRVGDSSTNSDGDSDGGGDRMNDPPNPSA